MPYIYDYPRPSVATDIIVCTVAKPHHILLIQRKNPPYEHMWALPGGFMDINERLHDTAKRELFEETGINAEQLNFFGVYDDIFRDPRGRTIGVVYYLLLQNFIKLHANDDAKDAQWYNIENLPPLAFDHSLIINDFKQKILTYC
ncbi:MAG: NUDIX hydrolase [Bacteroidales bacterium]|nr:NUDIX hydrolase [Bacteroidales bacterium]